MSRCSESAPFRQTCPEASSGGFFIKDHGYKQHLSYCDYSYHHWYHDYYLQQLPSIVAPCTAAATSRTPTLSHDYLYDHYDHCHHHYHYYHYLIPLLTTTTTTTTTTSFHSNRSRLLGLALRLVAVHCTGASRALNHMDKVEFRYE